MKEISSIPSGGSNFIYSSNLVLEVRQISWVMYEVVEFNQQWNCRHAHIKENKAPYGKWQHISMNMSTGIWINEGHASVKGFWEGVKLCSCEDDDECEGMRSVTGCLDSSMFLILKPCWKIYNGVTFYNSE